MRAYYDSQPAKFEAVGDGSYYYRWNIQQFEMSDPADGELTGGSARMAWQCDEVLVWMPITTDKVINAVIASKYSIAEEMRLLNDYNAYQSGSTQIVTDIVTEYKEYLSFTAAARAQVMSDFNVEQPVATTVMSARICDVVKYVSMTVNTAQLSDKEALSIKPVYPQWEELVGKPKPVTATVGMRLQYNDKLWKVLQEHTLQEQYKPGTGTESLYTEVVESTGDVEVGTKDSPIAYNNNMELENGKYYSQNGVVYKCTRDTGQPVYNPLSDLVGIYVEVAQ